MLDDPDSPDEDDTYRHALNPDDRDVYDHIDPTPVLSREVKALRLVLFKLIVSPEKHSREIVLTINTLCRVIYTESRSAAHAPDADGIASAADTVLQTLYDEGG
jgi:hypothetical protein